MNGPAGPVTIDGITLEPTGVDGRTWTYVPSGAVVEDGANGAMLSIVEAGPVAFLQCTARVALDDESRLRLLMRLQEIWPPATAVEPAPIAVERIVLEAREDAGWVSIAESAGSGMPPWRAALAATLTPAQLTAFKAATAGEPGHVRLRARITREAVAGTSWRAAAAGVAGVETSGHSSAFSYSTTHEHSSSPAVAGAIELTTDIADQLRPHGRGHR